MQEENQTASGCEKQANEAREENANAGRYELDFENMTDLGVDLNDLMNDQEENTFGISLYEDLIDINSIEVGRGSSSAQKTVENEVTLKYKIEKVLVIYKVSSERPGTTVLYEEENVDFGFSNDLIGKGTLILEKVQDPDVFALTWEGSLLECFVSNRQEVQEVSRYSFLVEYMIDIRLKVVQDDEFFIFIKSDFQLQNETVFLQFSFNSQEKANSWFEHLSKCKQQAVKRASPGESQSLSKKFKQGSADHLNHDSKTEPLSSGNSQVPKMSIPFFRDKKHSKKAKHVPNNALSHYQSENLFPLIRHQDKAFIENQIKGLIFSNSNSSCQDADDNAARPPLLVSESNKSVIQQKCSFIKFVVNSILTNNNLETKPLSLPSSSLPKPTQSSSSSSRENIPKLQSSKENTVNNFQPPALFTCPICYDTYNTNEIVTLEPCEHQICLNCEHKLVDSKCPWDRSRYTIRQ